MRLFSRLLLPAVLAMSISPAALGNEASDRGAIEYAAQAWTTAFNARDTAAMAALTTEDIIVLDPNIAPATGSAARKLWQRAFAAGNGRLANVTKEIVVRGDVAWRIGALAHTLPSGETVTRGQSLEIWQRTSGGWKLHRQMSSSLLSQRELLPRPAPPDPVLDVPPQ